MAKKKPQAKHSNKKETKEPRFSIDNYIPQKYQTIALFGVILLLFIIYYSPLYFDGQTYQSGDIVTSKSMQTYVENDEEGYTLWYPYIFCGMPAYGLAVDFKWFNLFYVGIYSVRAVFSSLWSSEYAMWTFYLLILAFTSYMLIFYLTKNRLLGLFGGIATSFSTGLILFLFIGHVTKLTAICFYPLIFLLLLREKEKISLRDFALLIIVLQLSIQGWHVQIIFYTLLSVAIYFVYYFVRSLYRKEKSVTVQILKTAGIFTSAFLIAVAIQSDNLTQIYEYNPYSTRGSESIVDKVSNKNPQKSDSEFYQYATNWSFSPGEVLTFLVPSYYGFGSSTYKGPLTKNQEVEVNTYFGQMPFVDVAMYMGVLVFFFALFGIYSYRKMPFVQFLTILILFSLLVSFGRTFPPIYDLMFYYFPFFDKFRVPSMILVLVQLSMPVLAALGIKRIIELRKEPDTQQINVLKYAAYAFTSAFVLSLLLNSVITGWFASRVGEHAASIQTTQQQLSQQFNALKDYMAEMFISDLYFGLAFLTISFWLAVAYLNKRISADLLVIAIIVLTAIDLIRIDNRGAKLNKETNVEEMFQAPEYVEVIKSQKDDQPYRIFNIKQDGSLGSFRQNSNFNGYFLLQDFYGYSSIKPRTYQDYMDVVGPVNPTMWNMLNVKYVITDRPFSQAGFNLDLIKQTSSSLIYENKNSLPRVYFVDTAYVKESYELLNDVKDNKFDPKRTAYLYDSSINVDTPDSTASAKVLLYDDERIEIEANASGNNLLFIGDTYYPNGWKAFIDDQEVPIYRVNHGFRGVLVPEGKHNVVLIYEPITFVISKYTALTLSSLTILMLLFSLYSERKKYSPGN